MLELSKDEIDEQQRVLDRNQRNIDRDKAAIAQGKAKLEAARHELTAETKNFDDERRAFARKIQRHAERKAAAEVDKIRDRYESQLKQVTEQREELGLEREAVRRSAQKQRREQVAHIGAIQAKMDRARRDLSEQWANVKEQKDQLEAERASLEAEKSTVKHALADDKLRVKVKLQRLAEQHIALKNKEAELQDQEMEYSNKLGQLQRSMAEVGYRRLELDADQKVYCGAKAALQLKHMEINDARTVWTKKVVQVNKDMVRMDKVKRAIHNAGMDVTSADAIAKNLAVGYAQLSNTLQQVEHTKQRLAQSRGRSRRSRGQDGRRRRSSSLAPSWRTSTTDLFREAGALLDKISDSTAGGPNTVLSDDNSGEPIISPSGTSVGRQYMQYHTHPRTHSYPVGLTPSSPLKSTARQIGPAPLAKSSLYKISPAGLAHTSQQQGILKKVSDMLNSKMLAKFSPTETRPNPHTILLPALPTDIIP